MAIFQCGNAAKWIFFRNLNQKLKKNFMEIFLALLGSNIGSKIVKFEYFSAGNDPNRQKLNFYKILTKSDFYSPNELAYEGVITPKLRVFLAPIKAIHNHIMS